MSNVADGLVRAYDRWSADWSLIELEEWLADAAVRAAIQDLAREIEAGGVHADRLDRALADKHAGFVFCCACDQALAACHPGHEDGFGVPPALVDVAAARAATGRFNRDTDGALLPKWVQPGRPGGADAVANVFAFVTRVPPALWKDVVLHVVTGANELPMDHHRASGHPRVACLPFADDLDQFDVAVSNGGGTRRYRLSPRADLGARVPRALEALDASDATVALLPEGVLDADVLEQWTGHCLSRHAATRLRWLVVGSGPAFEKHQNTAVVVDRDSGEIIAWQGKRSRFNLRGDDVKRWRLPLDPVAHTEDIEPDPKLHVLESRAGRVVLSVCEDLTRTKYGGILDVLGPSHVLVPIFSTEIGPERWEKQGAQSLVANVGATVVVCNSLGVIRARQAAGVADGPPNTALLLTARPDDYPGAADVRASPSWDVPEVFDLPPVV